MRISVIIPTLNESKRIRATLDHIFAQNPFEVIVADGGSTDGTLEMVRDRCKVVPGNRGRARQMNAGAASASGDVLLFVHADTLLPEHAFRNITRTIESGTPAGTFRLEFDTGHPLLAFSSFCTRIPALSLCFGDRVLFTTRELFFEVGMFPDQPVFEDIEMAKKLAAHANFQFLPLSVVTSSRRFVESGVWRQQWMNLRLWLRYMLGGSTDSIESEYVYPTTEK